MNVTARRRTTAASTTGQFLPTRIDHHGWQLAFLALGIAGIADPKRARGGAGLILSEGTLVSRQGSEWAKAPGIWSSAHVAGWKKITDTVHKEGAKMFCQVRVLTCAGHSARFRREY